MSIWWDEGGERRCVSLGVAPHTQHNCPTIFSSISLLFSTVLSPVRTTGNRIPVAEPYPGSSPHGKETGAAPAQKGATRGCDVHSSDLARGEDALYRCWTRSPAGTAHIPLGGLAADEAPCPQGTGLPPPKSYSKGQQAGRGQLGSGQKSIPSRLFLNLEDPLNSHDSFSSWLTDGDPATSKCCGDRAGTAHGEGCREDLPQPPTWGTPFPAPAPKGQVRQSPRVTHGRQVRERGRPELPPVAASPG